MCQMVMHLLTGRADGVLADNGDVWLTKGTPSVMCQTVVARLTLVYHLPDHTSDTGINLLTIQLSVILPYRPLLLQFLSNFVMK